ncbi:MAG: nitrilase-related carbon-nitrogen hydrolase, partial [Planctomycetota bacterium]
VVVTPRDGLIGAYRKLHLFNTEKSFFTQGDRFRLFDLPLREGGQGSGALTARLGVLICYDWAFPETWRTMMLMGADVIAHPSNLVLPGKAQAAVPVMAMMNRMAVVTANRYGEERGLRFTGESLIAGPDGTVLAHARPDADDVGTAIVSLQKIRDRRVTERNHALADRRPGLYAPICEEREEDRE